METFFLRQNDADIGLVADRVPRHFLVALFEDMERKRGSGEDNYP
jgi:hypothetical protein